MIYNIYFIEKDNKIIIEIYNMDLYYYKTEINEHIMHEKVKYITNMKKLYLLLYNIYNKKYNKKYNIDNYYNIINEKLYYINNIYIDLEQLELNFELLFEKHINKDGRFLMDKEKEITDLKKYNSLLKQINNILLIDNNYLKPENERLIIENMHLKEENARLKLADFKKLNEEIARLNEEIVQLKPYKIYIDNIVNNLTDVNFYHDYVREITCNNDNGSWSTIYKPPKLAIEQLFKDSGIEIIESHEILCSQTRSDNIYYGRDLFKKNMLKKYCDCYRCKNTYYTYNINYVMIYTINFK